MKRPTKSGIPRSSNRWRLQDAKARLSEVVRKAQQQGPQRVTVHGRDAVVVVRADEFDRIQRPVSGRDIVAALAASPLAEVTIERLWVLPSSCSLAGRHHLQNPGRGSGRRL